jgi:hypothetical protein
MFGTVVSLLVIAVVCLAWYAKRQWRRRFEERTRYVPTYADNELQARWGNRYGGRDAEAYDAGTGHHGPSAHGPGAGANVPPRTTSRGYDGS